MKTSCHCEVRSRRPELGRPGRKGEVAVWFLSGATLVLIPKCPVCLAAYIALATGIGISYSTASCLRILFVVLFVCSLTLLLAKQFKRLNSSKSG